MFSSFLWSWLPPWLSQILMKFHDIEVGGVDSASNHIESFSTSENRMGCNLVPLRFSWPLSYISSWFPFLLPSASYFCVENREPCVGLGWLTDLVLEWSC
ncbi:hypothetical protein BJ741DRAFT_615966, partial [Chytriomyces cf. hyalinus JEL632]